MQVPIGEEKEAIKKEQSLLELVAYNDTWGKYTDSYLKMLFERLILMKEKQAVGDWVKGLIQISGSIE